MINDHCRQVTPGTITTDRDAIRVNAQRASLLVNPLTGGDTVIHCRWEFMFWCQTIIQGDDFDAGTVGQLAAGAVMAIQVADHKAAAMNKDHAR